MESDPRLIQLEQLLKVRQQTLTIDCDSLTPGGAGVSVGAELDEVNAQHKFQL